MDTYRNKLVVALVGVHLKVPSGSKVPRQVSNLSDCVIFPWGLDLNCIS